MVRGAGGNIGSESSSTDERARDADEVARLCARGNPWRANPGRGCGVKQTHKAGGGSNRRGREKRRGRRVPGFGKPDTTTLLVDVAKREGNPMEGAPRREARGRHGTKGL